ncbi:metal-dependent phosphohydrolase [Methylobacterium indicum]|uniref:HD-GYP domain-containing protein n=1 Tax=Methylobacterium indicum TaxID=1775910 RepID=UPI0007347868|nr:HD domain-containing protein [Methylobacterium indicum]KTS38756.1 metal-dependent phosphohydrolase [Methylobacterium indicum]KTS42973.1 metal-dependent phosphohydrolase [Methylobacterium indicum]KTS44158.1 metal-dependent phosphohydrolase [Methylobacterium indicum]
MHRILMISDNPDRSRGLARDLGDEMACEIHDLYDDAPARPADALLADVEDHSAEALDRLRRILAVARRGAPFVVLLRRDTSRARLFGLALGASKTLCAPFDPARVRDAAGLSRPEALDPCSLRSSEEARQFFSTVFVPDGPVTTRVVDTGTDFIAQAVRDTGIRDWVRAVRRFDDATHQHCLLVTGLAAAFARSLGLGERECHRLTKAALLHDVGKIHVPSAILNKPGRLDAAEMAIVRQHPDKGYRMLAGQGFEPEMLAVVRSHHEMLDGSGYPDRLKQDEIPDLVRLVTVCDIYAALIEERPYKPPLPGKEAMAILDGMTGRIDPAVVAAFRPIATAFTPHFPYDA